MKAFGTLLVIALIAFTIPAHADDASKRAKVRELFALNHMEDRIAQQRENSLAQSRAMTRQLTDTMELNATQEKMVSACYEQMNQLIANAFNWAQLEPKYETIYVQTYTEEELDGVLAFYNSPVGRAYMAKTPTVTQKTLAVSNDNFAEVMPKIKDLLSNLLESLKQSGVRYKPV
jgi:hypothetical protein